ncbi:MAG TPA: hypothetical protein VI756_01015 [Blastocatellia bacterium]
MSGLFNSSVLDVAIGLIFVYLLLAIICSTVNEWISGLLNTRSKMLEAAISQLLDEQKRTPGVVGAGGGAGGAQAGGQAAAGDDAGSGAGGSQAGGQAAAAAGTQGSQPWRKTVSEDDPNGFLKLFYSHPLIEGMMKKGSHPSYLSSRTFSTVVIDIATAQKDGVIAFQDLQAGINALPPGDVKTALLALIQNTSGSLIAAQKAIEGWFNDTMDRLSGWYKRNTQVWIIIIASVVTVLSNADTIRIARELWSDPMLRSEFVEEAKTRVEQPTPSPLPTASPGPSVGTQSEVEQPTPSPQPTASPTPVNNQITDQELKTLGQLLGWPPADPADQRNWFERIWSGLSWEQLLGWILTAIAVSLGAPFWFDILKRIMNLRSAGSAPADGTQLPVQPQPQSPAAAQPQAPPQQQGQAQVPAPAQRPAQPQPGQPQGP